MNLPVPVYLRPLDQKDASMKVRNIEHIYMTYISLNPKEIQIFMTCSLFQLGCAAGVNLSGGRTAPTSELAKQIKGSQSSLDQLEQESKVRVSNVKQRLWLSHCVF